MLSWVPKSRRGNVLLLGVGIAVALALGHRGLLEYRLWRAQRALNQWNARGALVWLQAAERLAPQRSGTHFWMARAYRRLKQYPEVRSHLERAMNLGYPVEQLEREQWLALAQSGQLSKAEPHLPELLTKAGDDGAEICNAFVRAFFDAYRLDRAFELLDGWQADYPDDPQPHYLRGLFGEHGEKWPDAAQEYRRALTLAPHRYDVRLRLARVMREQHQYRNAIGHYRLCLKQNSNQPEALLGLGRCLQAQDKFDEAHDAYKKLLDQSADDFEGRLAIGELELAAGHIEEALRWLEPAAKQRPYDSKVRYALATALLVAGRGPEAQTHFRFYAKASEAKIRIKGLLKRVAADPTNVAYRYQIGTKLLRYGVPASGVVWLRTVLDLQPDHRPTHAVLADYYAQQGDAVLAAKHRRLAEGAGSNNHRPHRRNRSTSR